MAPPTEPANTRSGMSVPDVVLPVGLPAGTMGPEDAESSEGMIWIGGEFCFVPRAHYLIWSRGHVATSRERLIKWAQESDLAAADQIYESLRKQGLLIRLRGSLAHDSGVLRTYQFYLRAVGIGNTGEDPSRFFLAWQDGSPRVEVSAVLYPVLFASSRGMAIWDACAETAQEAGLPTVRLAQEALVSLPPLISCGVGSLDRRLH